MSLQSQKYSKKAVQCLQCYLKCMQTEKQESEIGAAVPLYEINNENHYYLQMIRLKELDILDGTIEDFEKL